MPEPFLLALASLLNAFTETGRWPTPVTQATVSMLSKIDGAFQVEQTRPITILSLVYRVWSRIYTAKFVKHIQCFLPDAIQGNRPGTSSKWVSAHIQHQIESALASDEGFHLVSLDLTKAYNLLSRVWIRECSGKFGVPTALSEAYLSFLGSLRRRFKVHASLNEPVESLSPSITCFNSIGTLWSMLQSSRPFSPLSFLLTMSRIGCSIRHKVKHSRVYSGRAFIG